ncbi:RNA polymerase sigma factor [Halomonas ramblicola]|uniref:RNA polymerase sigma factor n=1 Tax=Halomonas ramblicola TaxID=747349 RepID=UPI0025B32C26|nr:RNA polymerase sigma factor [Halomonas ramblicola]MDN3522212.1 RNA polymerase sigma factor [Halomonas ramblicola]
MTAQIDLDTLFRHHAGDLAGYLKRQLACPDLAEDLCQDVFLRIGQLRDPEALTQPRAYLFRIARNLIVDHHRRRRTRPLDQPLDDHESCLTCPRACPETATDHALCLKGLRAVLADLPPRLRQALVWHRLEGLTQAEIGRRLGVSERMAGRYVAQAIEHCRNFF